MPGALDKDLPVPLYHQLQEILRAEIEGRRWRADEQIPTESQIAERYGVSKITVRQALQRLAELGFIRREQGKGTFVERRKFDEGPRELTSFTEEMRLHDLAASSQILYQGVEPASAKVADALGLPIETPVFVLRRVRLAGGERMSIQTARIPAAFVPGIEVSEDVSLYEVLQGRFQLYATRARETYFAATADEGIGSLIGLAVGAPVFKVERVTLLANERPFEFVQSVVRGDRYSIVLDLIKPGGATAEGRSTALRLGRA
jgi:GntR family transcriptional regulator